MMWKNFQAACCCAMMALAAASPATAQTLTFEEGVSGTIVSEDSGNIFEYNESGITVSAINADPDHFHMFNNDIQIFTQDSQGARFTADGGLPFDVVSVNVTFSSAETLLVSSAGDMLVLDSNGLKNVNFSGITWFDWVFAAGADGQSSLDDLTVEIVPEPATWTLLLVAGLAALGYKRLRR